MADEQKTLIDITALKYFYKSLQNVTVLIAPSSIESASSQNLGRTYFIPADGTYAGLSCKKGDHIVSNGTTWVLIPKGTSEGGKEYFAGDGIDISIVDGKDTITNTGIIKIEESSNKGKVKVTTKDGTTNIAVHGLGTAAYETVGTEKTDITSTGTKVPNAKAVYGFVDDAIKALDVTDSAVTGKYVSAVSEADGKITVTRADLPTSLPASDVTDEYNENGTVPVSGKAVASAISGKLDANQKGAAGGVAELDANGKVLSSQLPSYVDDVVEASSKSAFPTTGESGKIYVDTTANLTYRWTGTAYTEISPSIALGETASTAFRGDHGKTAYDHATTTATNPHGTTKSDVGLGNVGNFKAVSTVTSQGLTDTEKSNARTNIGAGTYSKASTGIPKTDLAEAVQTSLGKADTALQSYTEKYTGTVTKVKVGSSGTEYSPSSGVVTIPAYPTSLPASNTTNSYSATGTVPVSGTAVASAISGKENSANKVSAWQTTPDNNHYPSEKLVKDSLNLKADKTELSSAINDVKTNILSTIVASSNASASNSKTLEFQGTGKNLEKLVIEGKTSQDGTPSPSAPVEVKGVGDIKNLLQNNMTTQTSGGVTFTKNPDGSVTLSGTSTGQTIIELNADYSKIEGKNVILTGCPVGGSSTKYSLNVRYKKADGSDGYIDDLGSGASFNVPTIRWIAIVVRSGANCNNLTFKPMVRLATDSDATFVPYGKYKIPISCGGKTSNIYLDTPLYDGEILDTEVGQREVRYVWKTIDGSISSLIKQTGANKYGVVNFYTRDLTSDDYTKAKCLQLPNQLRGAGDGATESGFRIESSMTYLRIHQSIATTVEELRTWLNNNPLKFLVPVSTATKETFEAPEITTTVGKNTLSVDTEIIPSKVEVTSFGEYYSKADVDKKISEVISYGNVVANGDLYNENLIDKSASYINVYYKPFSKTVIIDINLVPSKTWNSSNFSGVKRLCDIPSSVPVPSCGVRSYFATGTYSINFSKNNTNTALAINLISGEPTTTTTINTKIEYTVL